MAFRRMPSRGGVHGVLSAGASDEIAVPADDDPFTAEVLNRDAAETLWARGDGLVAVAEADGTTAIPPRSACNIDVDAGKTLSIVGNGNAYSVDHA